MPRRVSGVECIRGDAERGEHLPRSIHGETRKGPVQGKCQNQHPAIRILFLGDFFRDSTFSGVREAVRRGGFLSLDGYTHSPKPA
jgi:hypothetical protein